MTQVATALDRVAALLEAQLPGVPVFRVPPAENTPPREAVWLDETRAVWEWRALGGYRNRDEQIEITVRAHAWREGPDHLVAGAAARARCLELVDMVDAAIATDQTLGGLAGGVRVSQATVRMVPHESGWSAEAEMEVTVELVPSL